MLAVRLVAIGGGLGLYTRYMRVNFEINPSVPVIGGHYLFDLTQGWFGFYRRKFLCDLKRKSKILIGETIQV